MLTPGQVLAIPTGTWTNMAPTTSPEGRTHSPLTYHVNAGFVMLYGGYNASFEHLGDTWAYDYSANTWIDRAPSTSPPATGGHCLSYDGNSEQLIFFGGRITGAGGTLEMYHETWVYDYAANSWTNRTTAIHPPGRGWSDMTYVGHTNRQLMFGGLADGAAYLDDTWAYDNATNSWINRAPSTSPPARFDHRMVYDSESQRVILVGGIGIGTVVLSDVWAYDYASNTWTEYASFHTGIASQCLAYDSTMDRVILFGGTRNFDETNLNDETWLYDYNSDTWTQLLPDPHPPRLCRTYMAYDAGAQRSIFFGGRGPQPSPVHYDDTWAFYLFDFQPRFPWELVIAILVIIVIIILIIFFWRRRR